MDHSTSGGAEVVVDDVKFYVYNKIIRWRREDAMLQDDD